MKTHTHMLALAMITLTTIANGDSDIVVMPKGANCCMYTIDLQRNYTPIPPTTQNIQIMNCCIFYLTSTCNVGGSPSGGSPLGGAGIAGKGGGGVAGRGGGGVAGRTAAGGSSTAGKSGGAGKASTGGAFAGVAGKLVGGSK